MYTEFSPEAAAGADRQRSQRFSPLRVIYYLLDILLVSAGPWILCRGGTSDIHYR